MQGEGGLGVAEGGRHGWMDRGGREEMRDGRSEGEVQPIRKGLKDIKSFWESDYSMQREMLAL